jgi:hypothetical protein
MHLNLLDFFVRLLWVTSTLEILQEFIDKIIVYHRENIHGEQVQNVEIHYKMIGHVNIPSISKVESGRLEKCLGRKSAIA